MPADGFSLAVFIGRQIKVVRAFESVFEFPDLFFLVVRHDVKWREVLVRVDAEIRPRLLLELLGYLFLTGR